MKNKIILDGFNNLTKSLSYNMYDICHAKSKESQIEYLEYINKEYSSEKLHKMIECVVDMIGAKILNVSTQDYDPRGASVTVLISEPVNYNEITLAHLDKSHITAHTYPEYNPSTGITTFRVDIDVSTCGMISPLKTLNYLLNNFDSDIVLMDYKVRGFTRSINGEKIYIDHKIYSIQDYIDSKILNDYISYDVNIISNNIFHTKMIKKKMDIKDYLFDDEIENLSGKEKKQIKELLKHEMKEIFECKNF